MAVSGTYILAHDLGTTGNKASLFDERGALVESVFSGYETRYPRAGWAEQDPDDWWHAACECSRALLERSGVAAGDIAVIAFSAQMMAGLPLDVEGKPLRPAIIWADQRASDQAEEMNAICGTQELYRLTGQRISAAYTGPKILWIKEHEPEVYRRTLVFVQPKEYVAHRLTGDVATDYSGASGTNLFSLARRAWDEDVLRAVGIDRGLLPDAHPSHHIMGCVTPEAAAATGLLAGTPVAIGGGDGACATAGAGVVREGDAYSYIGSSAWMSLASPQPVIDPERRIVNFVHLDPELLCPMGTMQAAGGSYTWLSSWLGDRESNPNLYHEMDAWAAEVPPGSERLLFLPHLIGERSPYWNPLARGAFVGLSMNHGRGHAARATMEGVAYNLRMIMDALTEQGARIDVMRLIGGGAKSPVWRQIMADVLGLPIARPQLLAEATSLGAAMAGGVAVGIWPGYEVASDLVRTELAEEPDPEARRAYEAAYPLFKDAYKALEPIFARLADLPQVRSGSVDSHMHTRP